jgi:hypothetical protein
MSTEAPNGPANGPTNGSTTDSSHEPTTAPETSTMSQDDTASAASQFNDPTADPTADPTPHPTPHPATDPRDVAGPAAPVDPGATTTIPAGSTEALPTSSPFRVEPSAPVPDDAVTEATELPHLPPPAASQPDPSWPAPVVAPQPWQPALVTVRKGPRPGTVMLGLLTMLVAAYALVANLTDTDLSFRLVGPPMIGAFGGMLLIVGLAGVLAGRLRR